MKNRTLVNHPPNVAPPPGNQPVVAPIYQTVKYEFETVDETLRMLRGETPGYFYMRASNPTTRQLELTLAQLQGRDDCLATASGVNAIAQTLLSLTKSGDHVLFFIETYGPTRNIIRRLLARFGVENTMLSIEDLAGIENVLVTRKTRLVLFESPTNPVLKIADIERIVELAHRHGALAVLDNTFAGFHQHGEYDIDVFVHSLTKYASGAGDVMGGAVIAREELIEGMRPDFAVLGALLDPHAAFLVQRGLKTYFVRYREQTRAAQAIAEHLERHPGVNRVHYPGLASHPQAALARKQMREHGTVVSFDVKAGSEGARHFSEKLQLFALTASLGSTESLVMAPQLMGSRDFTAEQLRQSGATPATVRLSIGLEDLDDLLEDIDQALGPG
jgi:cystathionine beta-lyase/cystathionine gamma-synthase